MFYKGIYFNVFVFRLTESRSGRSTQRAEEQAAREGRARAALQPGAAVRCWPAHTEEKALSHTSTDTGLPFLFFEIL